MSHPLWYTIRMKMIMKDKKEQQKPEVQESTINIEGSINYDNLWNVQGYYNDDEGNDIRDRD